MREHEEHKCTLWSMVQSQVLFSHDILSNREDYSMYGRSEACVG
jgi:hypothetical protein